MYNYYFVVEIRTKDNETIHNSCIVKIHHDYPTEEEMNVIKYSYGEDYGYTKEESIKNVLILFYAKMSNDNIQM